MKRKEKKIDREGIEKKEENCEKVEENEMRNG
jgi:hypothetical protein